jgi:hypothetical protein
MSKPGPEFSAPSQSQTGPLLHWSGAVSDGLILFVSCDVPCERRYGKARSTAFLNISSIPPRQVWYLCKRAFERTYGGTSTWKKFNKLINPKTSLGCLLDRIQPEVRSVQGNGPLTQYSINV